MDKQSMYVADLPTGLVRAIWNHPAVQKEAGRGVNIAVARALERWARALRAEWKLTQPAYQAFAAVPPGEAAALVAFMKLPPEERDKLYARVAALKRARNN